MESASFMKVDEVAQELGISKSYAYKIVQKLNAELAEKGYMVISGRVNKQYFLERVCYGTADKRKDVI
jgi:predicted transcriptional regulator|nr:DNA-binding protein [Ruminococcus bromii]